MMNVIGGFVLWTVIGVLFFRWAKQQEKARRRTAAPRALAAAAGRARPPLTPTDT
jgi:hypothetical protein